jgi:hypothetical protein
MSTAEIEAYAGSGAKKLDEGYPLDRKEISALASLFLQNKYFAHLKFGIKQGRLEPEEIIKNIKREDAQKFEFLLLLGFLIKNGLDTNYYFEGPYQIKVHIAVFISTLLGAGTYKTYIFDLLQKSGSNFLNVAYTGGRTDSQTVGDVIGVNNTQPSDSIDIKPFVFEGSNTGPLDNIEWSNISNVILDKNFDYNSILMSGSVGTDPDILNFLNNIGTNKPLVSLAVLNMLIMSDSTKILEGTVNKCMIWNMYGGIQQSIYLAINGQNLDFFRIIIDKGGEVNYVAMTELICRHNMASKKKDNILKDTYSKMISYAIKTGSHIDTRQYQMLSLEASVQLIEEIREDYRAPEWKKLCRKSTLKSGFANKRLRQIAFDLNIDFGLNSGEICDKLEKINNIDRVAYLNSAIERQKERIARSLLESGEVTENTIERTRCNVKSTLIKNPYAYNDGKVAFYVEGGELYCFTSDLFESLLASRKNPYTGSSLPDSFLETLKSQVRILEFLGLKKSKDQNSIDETLQEVFDTVNEISNKNSDYVYNQSISLLSIITKLDERDIRAKLKVEDSDKIIKYFVNLSFGLFSNCADKIDLSYTSKNLEELQTYNNFKNPETNSFNYLNIKIYKTFTEMKIGEYLKETKFVEVFYVTLMYLFQNFYTKYENGRLGENQTFYGNDISVKLKEIYETTFDLK